LSFDWTDYLLLARELKGGAVSVGRREAKLRSSISRAYYSAFCSARNFLRDVRREIITSGARAHKVVKDTFENSGDQVETEVATNLERLRLDRNKADYDDNVSGLENMSGYALKLSEAVLLNIEQLRRSR